MDAELFLLVRDLSLVLKKKEKAKNELLCGSAYYSVPVCANTSTRSVSR